VFLNEKHKTENPSYKPNTIVQLHFNTPHKLGELTVLINKLWQTLGSSRGCSHPPAKDRHPGVVPTPYLPPGWGIKGPKPSIDHISSQEDYPALQSQQQLPATGQSGQLGTAIS